MTLQFYMMMARDYTKWALYQLLSLACRIIRNIIWWNKGVLKQIYQSKEPGNYATSAHKMTIIAQYRLDPFKQTDINDYILMHHSFLSPDYILRDDVHLMQVTAKDAIFVQIAKDAKTPDMYPFAILGYISAAKHVIRLPLESLHQLADNMEENPAKIIFIQNQTRCGGTLFTEIFKATDRCVTLSEPHAINGACMEYYVRNNWSRQTAVKVLKDITKIECKPRTNTKEKTLAYVIKPIATTMICTDLIQEALPDAIQFFIYRDPVQVAISLRRTGDAIPSFGLLYNLLPSGLHASFLRFLGCVDLGFRGWAPTKSMDIEWGYRTAANCTKYYLQYRETGTRIHGLRYENLQENPEKLIQKVFDICGLPFSLVPDAMDAFNHDSQEDTAISWENLQKVMPIPPKSTPAIRQALKEMSQDLGVPDPDAWLDMAYVLPGSIQL